MSPEQTGNIAWDQFDAVLFDLDPVLPPGIAKLRFPLTIRGARLRVEIEPRQTRFALEEGDNLRLECRGQQVQLSQKRRTVVVPYVPPEPAAKGD
jgi:trehalose/maltose hydrolase-like predicted phosphorylase